ncbi:unnamed protein product [Cylicostephanus goldi]|uniref:Uncharacterized protein n=1 Tax=Cylicostephanus goldi TaxID=71465 RepID=A0A3P7MDU8_CYLGO|nr:unnamed protein product [Cylicostephanus goldi]
MEGSKRRLPSGLYVISTKFGYMLSGRTVNNLENNKRQVFSTQSDKDGETWDRYWSLESAGTNEYTGTDKDEKQILEEKILKRFKETAVKRPEGYYVRLPRKDEHAVLPDNKQMALARLRSLFKQFRNREHELQEIDAIFKEQLEHGIIEVAPEETTCAGSRMHYLPYQVVFTPEKKTTPRRVVFDASAHPPKGQPSLNDLLHQGPVILPNIIGILMRFRVGQDAFTADIEKAFLQNMYVDNLVVTAETTEEALQQYKQIKTIFNDLKMNMRGFTSNDANFMQSIALTDKAEDTRGPKVSGIQWETNGDKLVIRCDTPKASAITKRTVLKMQASIYDPLGWLLPLLIRAKIFFQSLWSKSYTWDEILSEEAIKMWKKLQESMLGFHKEIPRKITNKESQCSLIAFSDASATSTAACIYIRDDCDRHLVIAKSKLPSLKAQHTIPKMEIYAMTIAARLLLTVYREVREVRMITDKLTADNIEVYFGYVSTKANPADCATRGLDADELQSHIW